MTTPTPELVALSEVAARLDRLGFALEPGDEVRDEIFSIRAALISAKFAIEATRPATVPQGVLGQDALDAKRYRALREAMLQDDDAFMEILTATNRHPKTCDEFDNCIDAAMTPPPAELGKGE